MNHFELRFVCSHIPYNVVRILKCELKMLHGKEKLFCLESFEIKCPLMEVFKNLIQGMVCVCVGGGGGRGGGLTKTELAQNKSPE